MPLATRTAGSGPLLLLVHGGVGPEVGWELQEPLAERFTLLTPWRRGYGESPPVEQQDPEVDAADLLELVGGSEPVHAAAFSYGALGLLLAAGSDPGRFRSLTLVEPPAFALAATEAVVQELLASLAALMQAGPGTPPPPELEGFVSLQKLSMERGFPPPPPLRPPFEVQPDYEAIREARIPVLVASGDHHPGWEKVCDALADALGAERAVLPGAGHGVMRAEGFNERFEAFVTAAG